MYKCWIYNAKTGAYLHAADEVYMLQFITDSTRVTLRTYEGLVQCGLIVYTPRYNYSIEFPTVTHATYFCQDNAIVITDYDKIGS